MKNPPFPPITQPQPADSAWARFRDEIRLQILTNALQVNRIHSIRFIAILKAKRVDPWLRIPGAAHMIPEALYKQSEFIITPERYVPEDKNRQILRISYPKRDVNHFVRNLEFRVECLQSETGPDRAVFEPQPSAAQDRQAEWLKKLADGDLGFRQVKTLRFVFERFPTGMPNQLNEQDFTKWLNGYLRSLESVKELRFRAKNVEVIIPDHRCWLCRHTYTRNSCSYEREQLRAYQRIQQLLARNNNEEGL
ncbi:hypothetical protein BDV95DRAFT_615683 [Massariosphaeria phaeospora]|uniref:Uncharacterized protein n=1 Tax=Massariosphaeria phaeospora TaxID=100035 RepID=A0A7C8IBY6_9PLEO|nr:hypothetical protein BDV95DRAFT_615683 [Massariosphaeria phaeospora]